MFSDLSTQNNNTQIFEYTELVSELKTICEKFEKIKLHLENSYQARPDLKTILAQSIQDAEAQKYFDIGQLILVAKEKGQEVNMNKLIESLQRIKFAKECPDFQRGNQDHVLILENIKKPLQQNEDPINKNIDEEKILYNKLLAQKRIREKKARADFGEFAEVFSQLSVNPKKHLRDKDEAITARKQVRTEEETIEP